MSLAVSLVDSQYRVSGRREVLSPLEVSEGLAHAEMARKHGVRFVCLAGPCRMPAKMAACHVHNVRASDHPTDILQTSYKQGAKQACGAPPFESGAASQNWAPIFMVAAVGVAADEVDVGFEFTTQEMARWMDTNQVCGSLRDMSVDGHGRRR